MSVSRLSEAPATRGCKAGKIGKRMENEREKIFSGSAYCNRFQYQNKHILMLVPPGERVKLSAEVVDDLTEAKA